MDLNEVQKFIAENKDTDEVKAFIGALSAPVDERVIIDKYKTSAEFKKDTQSESDRKVAAALERFQKEHMSKAIEDEIKKRYPDETSEQKALREMKAELDSIKTAKSREELRNKAVKNAQRQEDWN